MSDLTDKQLQDWLVRASHAGPWKPWQHGPTAEANAEDVTAYLRGLYEAGGAGPVHTVHDGGPDGEALIVAITGNGERSKANAEFIAWSSPSNVSLALTEIRRLRADLAAARRELEEDSSAPAALGSNVIVYGSPGPVRLSSSQREEVRLELCRLRQRAADLKMALGDGANWFDRAMSAERERDASRQLADGLR